MLDTSLQPPKRLTGPERLLDTAGVSIDRMPMLHVIFDRMVAQCSESLRQYSAAPAVFTVSSIGTERIGDILDAYENNTVVAIIHVQAWDSRILVGFDRAFISTLIETFYGGDGSEPPNIEKRPLSNIEIKLAQTIFDLLPKALQTSFSTISETVFKFERLETKLDFAVIAPRNTFGFITRINLRILGRHGEMFVVIPQSSLNSIRQELGRDLANDAVVRDPRWTKQIQNEISRTEVEVRAIIEDSHFVLGDFTELKIGQVLPLQATTKSRAKLECNAEPLFWCQVGQEDGFYTLRVEDFIDQEKDFIEGISGA
ncbi:flagellar motor switch protein FliM [Beijerinckia indica]|uniref:Flagellar motor switch protein FliM n=1 Tax=Beijerinckia indica subsp. indica (strain ATCC 9039 / DSM 1715 / NCIMB 8712) TaxID=395963 RepID=B2IJZ9_BEII9|nr:FliM/FliN family flagellar motor switch protein [Beijerinckia indica]ACB96374.1 flagellar motor switch protein FliM [Beijerinckia indica subsp. indica ATCC 9039]